MLPIPIASGKFPVFTLRGAHCIALFTLIALSAVLIAGSAVAEQRFALIGTWEHTDKNGVSTIAFNPDGTFNSKTCVGTGANGQGSGCAQWRGKYRATGASSWAAQVQSFRNCASGGGCNSCPRSRGDLPGPGNYGCEIAKNLFGITLGVRMNQSWQMQGANQGADRSGQTWRRVRR
jgi:hypothetical protein